MIQREEAALETEAAIKNEPAGLAAGMAPGGTRFPKRLRWSRALRPRKPKPCSKAEVQAFCIRNFLPMGLAMALIIGLSWPWLGVQVRASRLRARGSSALF